jgi:uncharacterized protein (DUF362 family)
MKINRRQFIERIVYGAAGAIGASAFLSASCSSKADTPDPLPFSSPPETTVPTVTTVTPAVNPAGGGGSYLSVVRGENPSKLVQTAVQALGGIERFVKKGDDVIIKPNICVDYRTYEYAATTNPDVVGAGVSLCVGAGARRVRVMDNPFGGTAARAYASSGIADAVKAAGGQMEVMSRSKYREVEIPDGRDIKSWQIYQDVIDADVLINVPIVKHHNLARMTCAMKNLLGVVLDPAKFHFNLGQRVSDLNSRIRSNLTIVDAVRVLMSHGPTGGTDIVACDSYAATLLGLTGDDIPVVRSAAAMGLGISDLKGVKIEEINA